jgi:hypothetical protein
MPAPPALHASPHARRETSTLRQTQTRALQQQDYTAATASHLVSSQPSDQLPRPLHWLELVPAIALQLDDAGFACMRTGDAQGDKVCVAGRGGGESVRLGAGLGKVEREWGGGMDGWVSE